MQSPNVTDDADDRLPRLAATNFERFDALVALGRKLTLRQFRVAEYCISAADDRSGQLRQGEDTIAEALNQWAGDGEKIHRRHVVTALGELHDMGYLLIVNAKPRENRKTGKISYRGSGGRTVDGRGLACLREWHLPFVAKYKRDHSTVTKSVIVGHQQSGTPTVTKSVTVNNDQFVQPAVTNLDKEGWPNRSHNQIHDQMGVSDNKNPPLSPKGENGGCEDRSHEEEKSGFDDFWNTWPNHKWKTDTARRRCKKIWIDNDYEPDAEKIVSSLRRWKRTREWREDRGRYMPSPTTWLSDRDRVFMKPELLIPADDPGFAKEVRLTSEEADELLNGE